MLTTRIATLADAAAITRIYNQGIEERMATFETALRSDDDILAWFDGVHPIVVVTDESGEVIAFARASEYSSRECYRGIFELRPRLDDDSMVPLAPWLLPNQTSSVFFCQENVKAEELSIP